MTEDPRIVLGKKVRAARLGQRYDVKAAANAAGIARDTWVKIEAGDSVQDTKRAAATAFLGLDLNGDPARGGRGDLSLSGHVGPQEQDAKYVASPGERVEAGDTEDAVLRAINAMRADVEKLARLPEAVADLARRMEKIERSSQSVDGTSGTP